MTEVKFIPPELLLAVKNIPIENVIEKIFNEDNTELGGKIRHREDRSGGKFKIYKNDKYTFFINPLENNVTIKRNDNDETWIGNADTVGLVERSKYWDFWDSNNKKPVNMKEMFKKSVLWLATEFDLIKDIKNGKIELDLKEIQAVELKTKSFKEEFLFKIEQKMEEAKLAIKSYKNKESLGFDKEFRGIDKELMELLVNNGSCKLFKNPEKGNRDEIKIALRDTEGNVQGIQTLYYNIYEKRWDKRNVGDAQVSWFGNKKAENMVITESFMDSASAAQTIATLKNMDYTEVMDNYLFISTNGELGNLKKETIKKFLEQNNVKKVILAHDNDRKGEIYDKIYLKGGEFWEYVKDKNLVVFKPKNVKDMNDFVKSDDFKTGNFKGSLIMQKAEDYYKDYLREMKIEEKLKKEAVLNYDPGKETEEEKDMDDMEVRHDVADVVESVKSSNPPIPSGNVKLSDILPDLMESKTVNNKTNYFYKIDEEFVKFAKFTAKMKGVTKKGVYGVFFKENDFIEVDKNGKEKGSGLSILYGKDVKNKKDAKNIVFSTSMTDGLKLLKAKGVDIKNSVIIGIKSASVETEILYEQLVEHFFTGGNSLRVKNVFVIGNNKKNGQFLESLLNNKNWYYRLSDFVWPDTNVEVHDESDLKDIKLEMDVFDTAPAKSVKRGNPKKEKEPVLSV
ncbi:MAG: toprim domain-containing protein [Nautiliaceae bacterium]